LLYENPMHPYTQSLLSAIPIPDPDTERTRKRRSYDPSIHQYTADEKVEMREVTENHFVYCSEKEYKLLKEKSSS
jgi:oligopeptide transport system ATP-binding protein